MLLQVVPTAKGQALADEYGIKFFETVNTCAVVWSCHWWTYSDFTLRCIFKSAKTNLNVEQVFFSIARDIKQRLSESESKPEVWLHKRLVFMSMCNLFTLFRVSKLSYCL
jgi:Ras-related protein Rab-8A